MRDPTHAKAHLQLSEPRLQVLRLLRLGLRHLRGLGGGQLQLRHALVQRAQGALRAVARLAGGLGLGFRV